MKSPSKVPKDLQTMNARKRRIWEAAYVSSIVLQTRRWKDKGAGISEAIMRAMTCEARDDADVAVNSLEFLRGGWNPYDED